ncbi:UNVERIFIED_CONTAM: hypothetical protein Sindi_1062700 [Sesamum indicum]
MLRSSSTPVLGSLLPSFAESPNSSSHHLCELHGSTQKHTPNTIHGKLSCTNGGSQNLSKSLFHSPSVAEIKGTSRSSGNEFRRAQSEGNLQELVDASYNVDEFSLSKKSARKSNSCTLEAIPSFSVHHPGARFEDGDSDDEEEAIEEEGEVNDEELEVEDSVSPFRMENLLLEQMGTNVNGYGSSLRLEGEGKMYLAAGLGISGISFIDGGGSNGGGGSYRPVAFDRDGGDSHGLSMEEHYKNMVEGDPGNPLKKGDLQRAEEYYSRAILADPEDGEILSQYAKLIWELHHDKERAAIYFERALQASSDDSHIHAAYASFLWDTEEDEENATENSRVGQLLFHRELMASATA